MRDQVFVVFDRVNGLIKEVFATAEGAEGYRREYDSDALILKRPIFGNLYDFENS